MKIKKLVGVATCISLLMMPTSSFASEMTTIEPETIVSYDINPGVIVLEENQNYENPVTGEYFRWENNTLARDTVAKNFSFSIHSSVISSSFSINSSKLNVMSNAELLNLPSQSYIDGTYDIEIKNGWLNAKTKNFDTGYDEHTYRGLNPSKTCKITISNDGTWDRYNHILEGSGTVYNVE